MTPLSAERRGDWIQTFSGKKFWPLDPRPEDVALADIAHALAMTCRFGGHTRSFYSVAQHCGIVSALVGDSPERLCLPALLHDAAEAYLVDMPRPIKRQPELAALKKIEARIEVAIAERFGFDPAALHHPDIKKADLVALATEARDLMGVTPNPGEAWGIEPPAPFKIRPMDPDSAKTEFLAAFYAYGGEA